MAEKGIRASSLLDQLLSKNDLESMETALLAKTDPSDVQFTGGYSSRSDDIRRRLEELALSEESQKALTGCGDLSKLSVYAKNIENLIGTAQLPIGIAGPLRVNGLHAQGDYLVPLATHEAALVASYHRGALAVTAAGGCTSLILNDGVSRAPGFVFDSSIAAGKFVVWALSQKEIFTDVAESTTQYGKLIDLAITVEGNHVYLRFDFTTGDASGQNMVTIATDAVCAYIAKNTPIQPKATYVEANLSGDKKASAQSFQHVRGKKVTCEVSLPREIIKKYFNATAAQMVDYWRMSAIGGVLSGTIGIQGHYANGLAALFIACGQDAACVAEASVGVTRFEERDSGALYATVTLPNLIVGTVGGGTGLPTQSACLEIMGLQGAGHARAFAEVCAGAVLSGELSIIAALATGNFSRAHRVLARLRK